MDPYANGVSQQGDGNHPQQHVYHSLPGQWQSAPEHFGQEAPSYPPTQTHTGMRMQAQFAVHAPRPHPDRYRMQLPVSVPAGQLPLSSPAATDLHGRAPVHSIMSGYGSPGGDVAPLGHGGYAPRPPPSHMGQGQVAGQSAYNSFGSVISSATSGLSSLASRPHGHALSGMDMTVQPGIRTAIGEGVQPPSVGYRSAKLGATKKERHGMSRREFKKKVILNQMTGESAAAAGMLSGHHTLLPLCQYPTDARMMPRGGTGAWPDGSGSEESSNWSGLTAGAGDSQQVMPFSSLHLAPRAPYALSLARAQGEGQQDGVALGLGLNIHDWTGSAHTGRANSTISSASSYSGADPSASPLNSGTERLWHGQETGRNAERLGLGHHSYLGMPHAAGHAVGQQHGFDGDGSAPQQQLPETVRHRLTRSTDSNPSDVGIGIHGVDEACASQALPDSESSRLWRTELPGPQSPQTFTRSRASSEGSNGNNEEAQPCLEQQQVRSRRSSTRVVADVSEVLHLRHAVAMQGTFIPVLRHELRESLDQAASLRVQLAAVQAQLVALEAKDKALGRDNREGT